jgi:hypothetical protein
MNASDKFFESAVEIKLCLDGGMQCFLRLWDQVIQSHQLTYMLMGVSEFRLEVT